MEIVFKSIPVLHTSNDIITSYGNNYPFHEIVNKEPDNFIIKTWSGGLFKLEGKKLNSYHLYKITFTEIKL